MAAALRSRIWRPTAASLARPLSAAVSGTTSVDICVVGGGIVGAAAACAIARSPYTANYRIALIEAGDIFKMPSLEPGQFANRASSITPASARFLHDIGAWDRISRKNPYFRMQVWDTASDGKVTFDALEQGAPNAPGDGPPTIAWIIENHLIQQSLVEMITQMDHTTLYNQTRVETIAKDPVSQTPILTLANGQRIECQLLVGADGINSKVREFAGIDVSGWDYNQHGLVATLEVEKNDAGNITAWQRYLSTGPIAMLPLDDGHASLVWSTTPENAKRYANATPDAFVELVNAAFWNPEEDVTFLTSQISVDGSVNPEVDVKAEAAWGFSRIGGGRSIVGERPPRVTGVQAKSRGVFPLRLRNADAYATDNVVLIGDTAHTVHPQAGQGLNLGLGDARVLAERVSDAAASGTGPGSWMVCSGYARSRYSAGVGMLAAVDGAGRLFGLGGSAAEGVRGAGLRLLDGAPALKRALVALASS